MTCERFALPDGGTAIVCSRGRRSTKKCSASFCDAIATRLCDAPLRGAKAGKTCDRPLCDSHASHEGPDVDLCPQHASPSVRAACVPGDAELALREVVGFQPRDLDDWREFVAERAAIAEYVGGLSRDAAERQARELAGPPPGRYRAAGPLFAGAR